MNNWCGVRQSIGELMGIGDGGSGRRGWVARRVFERAATAWSNYRLEKALSFMSEDVEHTLNVDGEIVPFAASVKGKAAMRKKLQMVLDTFEIGAYVTDHVAVQGCMLRANMRIVYIHRATGERLITRFRFVIRQRNGLMERIDEFHDAAYLESFMRYVSTPANGRK